MKSIVFGIYISVAITIVVGYPDGDTVSRVKDDGYPIEEHDIVTSDGYIITMHRIPFSPNSIGQNNSTSKKPPIYLQHGLTTSSSDWVIGGPGKALAYLLSDAGYDVWMGNVRGNKYSLKHNKLDSKSKAYWNFSWHEIALFDVSAMIDYILAKTGHNDLHYVGHSQGTTVFFVLMSVQPEYNEKIRSMHAYAPVAYMSHAKSPLLNIIAPIIGDKHALVELIGSTSLSPSLTMITKLGYKICKDESIVQEVCANALFLVCGYNSENLNRTLIPDILANVPAGCSINQVLHFVQAFISEKFRMFDYGYIRNLFKYKSFSPPEYDLSKITAPVSLYYGDNDWMSAVEDVQILASKLKNLKLNHRLPLPKWNHLDFLWGIKARELLFDFTIDNIEKYN